MSEKKITETEARTKQKHGDKKNGLYVDLYKIGC